MSYAPQSSPGQVRLPAFLLGVCLLAGPLAAQEGEALSTPADLHREPRGTPLVTLSAGASVETGEGRGDWREVTVEGWIYTPSTSPTRRDGFDLVVSEVEGENLRRAPNGPVVGRARQGTLLERVGQKGNWTRVRRAGWVPDKAVTPPPRNSGPRPQGGAPAATPKPPPKPAAADPSLAAGERRETTRETAIGATPEGPPLGTLQAGTSARVLGRSGDWARVQVEGWVRDADLQLAEGGALPGVTAAEVRAAPERFVGQTLEWRLQVIAVQTADELRAELPPGQPYLLTRGPLPEPGFVYVAVPPERVEAFRALPPLQEVVLRVTIRAARTRYLTTPVAELVSVVAGME
ncbi:MAG TPA: SH3 domain-containing protein [Gemmatimonadales bacterium]|nr:SH3 domain-containing protein [Gemmatimonadales bacterium]